MARGKGKGNVGSLDRPLRYRPINGGFEIENGTESFNRPLYGCNTAFRADAGDNPEVSLFLPGRGGNLRLGLKTSAGAKWFVDAPNITAQYIDGSMRYRIADPLWTGEIAIDIVALHDLEAVVVRVRAPQALPADTSLFLGFGGASGERGSRNGDIGTERQPVTQFFQLRPENCRGQTFTLSPDAAVLDATIGRVACIASAPMAAVRVVDPAAWNDPAKLLQQQPIEKDGVCIAELTIAGGGEVYVGLVRLQRDAENAPLPGLRLQQPPERDELKRRFDASAEYFRKVAQRVVVQTPDPFINSAVAALCVAAEALWDEPTKSIMHGGVAWRNPLLGWRGPYCGDALGNHDRTRLHLERYFSRQNTDPIPATIPPADENAGLARSETAIHSNGNFTSAHYDMNLVAIDALIRHLYWTGDLDYARKCWPLIERHMAWEKRLFRREYGPGKLPLYEAYACIWASDDLQYHGGGATHSTAYNLFHNQVVARLATLLGADPAPYEAEAKLIRQAMNELLWLKERGWYAEFKDLLGNQLVHDSAALWTHYHTIDCMTEDRLQGWQMTRYVDTRIPHLPIRGEGVPADRQYATLSTTNWMPYTWSINNVAMAEVVHTALAGFQTGRDEAAFTLLKSALLDSMFMGLCPGNVHMCSELDVYRRESQRDSGDPTGATSRAVIEGLFGVQIDQLKGVLRLDRNWPDDWESTAFSHTDLEFQHERKEKAETFAVTSKWKRHPRLLLRLPARATDVESVRVNGAASAWQNDAGAVGWPWIQIDAPAAPRWQVEIIWKGDAPARSPVEAAGRAGEAIELTCAPAEVRQVNDPQGVLEAPTTIGCSIRGSVRGAAGARTVFAKVAQGQLSWWLPFHVEVSATAPATAPSTVSAATAASQPSAPLNIREHFNDRVTQIFKNQYRSPRAPHGALAMPVQGIGGWAGSYQKTANIDDTGLRETAARNGGVIAIPNGGPTFMLPTAGDEKNIAFVSQWDNYPREVTIPLSGRGSRLHLLMAGSTNHMQSRFENGELIVTYADGSTARLALVNPTNWWPIEQDYLIDDYAFARPEPVPVRIELRTGRILMRTLEEMKAQGGRGIDGGAATVLDLALDGSRDLRSLTLRAIANEVVIGLMAVSVAR